MNNIIKTLRKLELQFNPIENQHNNRKFFMYNDELEYVIGDFHCKDFFQEWFASYFLYRDNFKIYGFETKIEDLVKIDNSNNIYILIDCKFLELKKNENHYSIISSFLKYFNDKLLTNIQLLEIEYSDNTQFLFKIDKKYFNYPVLASLILYTIRTTPDLLINSEYFDINNLSILFDKLFKNDIKYFSQHVVFKNKIIDDNYSLKDIYTPWLVLAKEFNGIISSDYGNNANIVKENIVEYLHDSTGFCSRKENY